MRVGQNPIAKARHYETALAEEGASYRTVAPQFQVTREEVCQYMALLKRLLDDVCKRVESEREPAPGRSFSLRRLERERLMASLSPLDEKLLQLAREHGRLTLAAAAKLTRANRNTIKLHFRQLVEAGRLRLRGRARAPWYEIA